MDELPFLHVDFRDDAGDVVGEVDDIRLHIGVLGRGVASARQVEPERAGDDDDRTREQQRPTQGARLSRLGAGRRFAGGSGSALLFFGGVRRRLGGDGGELRTRFVHVDLPRWLSHGSTSARAPRLQPDGRMRRRGWT